jgi:sugar (pentulose or hexulose) kinase
MAFLGIDVGSSSVKACVIDHDGRILDFVTTDIGNLIQRPAPSWAERDPETLWNAVRLTLQKLTNQTSIESICVDATSGSVLAVDRDLRALCPILLYSDKRAEQEAKYVLQESSVARDYEVYLPLDPYLVLPKILWMRSHLANFGKVNKILNEGDFIQMKLTGEVCTSPNVAGKAHIDIRSGDYLRDLYEDLRIDMDLLPPVKPIGKDIGHVSESSSDQTKLPEKAVVINGITDSTASDVATGTLDTGQLNACMGTSLVVHAVAGNPIPDRLKRIYYKSYLQGRFLAGGATDAGTLPMTGLSRLLGKAVQELDLQAEKVPTGCEGLIAQPQWIGSRVPNHNPNVRGFFTGITERNFTAGHLFRSILEGNAVMVSQLVDIIEDVTRARVLEIRTSGGGSKSDIQNHTIADATGRAVLAIETNEASIGSAILAAWGLTQEPISIIARRVVRIRRRFEPNLQVREMYMKVARRLQLLSARIYDEET